MRWMRLSTVLVVVAVLAPGRSLHAQNAPAAPVEPVRVIVTQPPDIGIAAGVRASGPAFAARPFMVHATGGGETLTAELIEWTRAGVDVALRPAVSTLTRVPAEPTLYRGTVTITEPLPAGEYLGTIRLGGVSTAGEEARATLRVLIAFQPAFAVGANTAGDAPRNEPIVINASNCHWWCGLTTMLVPAVQQQEYAIAIENRSAGDILVRVDIERLGAQGAPGTGAPLLRFNELEGRESLVLGIAQRRILTLQPIDLRVPAGAYAFQLRFQAVSAITAHDGGDPLVPELQSGSMTPLVTNQKVETLTATVRVRDEALPVVVVMILGVLLSYLFSAYDKPGVRERLEMQPRHAELVRRIQRLPQSGTRRRLQQFADEFWADLVGGRLELAKLNAGLEGLADRLRSVEQAESIRGMLYGAIDPEIGDLVDAKLREATSLAVAVPFELAKVQKALNDGFIVADQAAERSRLASELKAWRGAISTAHGADQQAAAQAITDALAALVDAAATMERVHQLYDDAAAKVQKVVGPGVAPAAAAAMAAGMTPPPPDAADLRRVLAAELAQAAPGGWMQTAGFIQGLLTATGDSAFRFLAGARTILYLITVAALVLFGLSQVYVDAAQGATFGAGGLLQYAGAFLWGFTAEAATKRFRDIALPQRS